MASIANSRVTAITALVCGMFLFFRGLIRGIPLSWTVALAMLGGTLGYLVLLYCLKRMGLPASTTSAELETARRERNRR